MDNSLLVVAIVLLTVLILLIGVTLYFVLRKHEASALDERELSSWLADNRAQIAKDINGTINDLKGEINTLKADVTKSMGEAKNENKDSIYKFLSETNGKLDDIQSRFIKESGNVQTSNSNGIQELIRKTSGELSDLRAKMTNEIHNANLTSSKRLDEENSKVQNKINEEIGALKNQVEQKLQDGFKKNEDALNSFIEKTAKIEESTKQMGELKGEIDKLNQILNNQKTRGNFGESILDTILSNSFGEPYNDKEHSKDPYRGYQPTFYEKQVNFTKKFGKEGKKEDRDVIADFTFNIRTKDGILPLSIDSKFPYTIYVRLLDENLTPGAREQIRKDFEVAVKKQIKEVTKYIVKDQTAPYAIMFIPAEAVFIDIFKSFPSVVSFARDSRVILASPSLIITIIGILSVILEDYQRAQNAQEILERIDAISAQFGLFSDRYKRVREGYRILDGKFKELDITVDKVGTEFDRAKKLIDVKKSQLEAPVGKQEIFMVDITHD